MEIDDDNLNLLLSDKFVLDLIDITLTQQTKSEPNVYSGPGSIYQKKDGSFYLKLYHTFNNFYKEQNPISSYTKSGRFISKDNYYSMVAEDMSGKKWHAQDIALSFNIPLWQRTRGMVIETTINSLHYIKTDVTNDNASFYLVLPGVYKIPCNKVEVLSNGTRVLNTLEFTIQDVCIEIKDKNDFMIISVQATAGKLSSSFKEILIESLCILFGKLCPVLMSSVSLKDENKVTINSIEKNNSNIKIPSPISYSSSSKADRFTEFINGYLEKFGKEHDVFFGYWHKINRAWQGGIDNAALAITTSIEGVTKHYYAECGKIDDEMLEQAKVAKSLINQLQIGEKIKQRIESSLAHVKSVTPRNALFNLADEISFDNDLVHRWSSLRNKATHSDVLEDNKEARQKYLDDVFKCTTLFNILLLNYIGYKGIYQDFSKEGWVGNSLALGSAIKEK